MDAALAGLDQGEFVTIPSLPDAADWDAYEAARQKLIPNLSLSTPARPLPTRLSLPSASAATPNSTKGTDHVEPSIDPSERETIREPTAEPAVDLKLEVVAIPVADVDRSKRFYGGLGWRLDADFEVGDSFRVVQFTPPGSPSSIHFGKGVTSAAPGSAQGLFLVVSDIEAARVELVRLGANVSEIFHRSGPGQPAISGRDPEGRSYVSYATFSDPDGNSWLLQEITSRIPGRVDSGADQFRHGAGSCGRAETRCGRPWRTREARRRTT